MPLRVQSISISALLILTLAPAAASAPIFSPAGAADDLPAVVAEAGMVRVHKDRVSSKVKSRKYFAFIGTSLFLPWKVSKGGGRSVIMAMII
ncbi:MAG: hypothetical protein BWY65_02410 [Firmicutes bacterium ADurb.Bin373]|nr:MAG: hypothetical protein BWY65_02410 [Firmicutes bacterium ADurb.Bin373]